MIAQREGWNAGKFSLRKLKWILGLLILDTEKSWLKRIENRVVDWWVWHWPTVTKVLSLFLAIAIAVALIFTHDGWGWYDKGSGILSGLRNYGLALAGVVAAFIGLARLKQQQESHIVDALQKATEQLKSEDVTIKLLAISQLWRIATDDPRRSHIPVMQALTHSLRAEGEAISQLPEFKKRPDRLSEQAAAIMELLQSRSHLQHLVEEKIGYSIDLTKAFLKGGSFEGYNLETFNLTEVNFEAATLSDAGLYGACLVQTNFAKAHAVNADFRFAIAAEAKFNQADLALSDFRNTDAENAVFEFAILSGAEMNGAHMAYASLKGAMIKEADLENAELSYSVLREAKVVGASLRSVVLDDADLIGTNLNGSCLRDATLYGTDLQDAFCINTSFEGAVLRGANLNRTEISRANFFCADITETQLDVATWRDKNPPTSPEGEPYKRKSRS